MHVPAPQPTDLSARRRSVGASRETMAAGVGLSIDEVRAIENGSAAPPLRARYSAWLDRLENWPAERRQAQLLAAGAGRPFEP